MCSSPTEISPFPTVHFLVSYAYAVSEGDPQALKSTHQMSPVGAFCLGYQVSTLVTGVCFVVSELVRLPLGFVAFPLAPPLSPNRELLVDTVAVAQTPVLSRTA